jgi:hypothetical protein
VIISPHPAYFLLLFKYPAIHPFPARRAVAYSGRFALPLSYFGVRQNRTCRCLVIAEVIISDAKIISFFVVFYA